MQGDSPRRRRRRLADSTPAQFNNPPDKFGFANPLPHSMDEQTLAGAFFAKLAERERF